MNHVLFGIVMLISLMVGIIAIAYGMIRGKLWSVVIGSVVFVIAGMALVIH